MTDNKVVSGVLLPTDYLRWMRIISNSQAKRQINTLRNEWTDLIVKEVLGVNVLPKSPEKYREICLMCAHVLHTRMVEQNIPEDEIVIRTQSQGTICFYNHPTVLLKPI